MISHNYIIILYITNGMKNKMNEKTTIALHEDSSTKWQY